MEVLRLVVYRRDCGKDGQSAGFMRFTDVIEVFHAAELFELTRDWIAGLVRLVARILLLEQLDPTGWRRL